MGNRKGRFSAARFGSEIIVVAGDSQTRLDLDALRLAFYRIMTVLPAAKASSRQRGPRFRLHITDIGAVDDSIYGDIRSEVIHVYGLAGLKLCLRDIAGIDHGVGGGVAFQEIDGQSRVTRSCGAVSDSVQSDRATGGVRHAAKVDRYIIPGLTRGVDSAAGRRRASESYRRRKRHHDLVISAWSAGPTFDSGSG